VRVSRVGEDGDRVLLRFSVADTGIGIAKDDIDRLFEPFTQVDSSTTRQYGGTGLGLTICRRIVELMGGTIGVDSQLGEGSCFWFVVPLQPETPVQVSEAEGQSSSTDEEIQAAIGRLRILIVEDRPDSRELLMLLIQPFGCMVDWVENGREALERLEEQGYDLIFMDCQMPELDGYEATRRLREREAQSDRRTVVVGLTAYALQGDREKCLEAGMDDYLSKPLTREALDDLLTRWADSTGYQPPSE
jgi:two-component system CheB/CheR fusion protein